jgi:hypothetical protein
MVILSSYSKRTKPFNHKHIARLAFPIKNQKPIMIRNNEELEGHEFTGNFVQSGLDSVEESDNDSAKPLPLLPPEIIDIILLYIGRVGLVYALDRLAIMKHFLPNDFEGAKGYGFYEALKFFEGEILVAPNLIDWTAATGRLRYLRYLTNNTEQMGSIDALESTAFYGHLEAVKYLHFNRNEDCSKIAINAAASKGNFNIVKFLHENRSEGCTKAAMDDAAHYGHLEVVKYLHYNRTEGCSVNAMDYAAESGHFEVVKYLHKNRSEGCTEYAVNGAAFNGHFEVVKFLLKNSYEFSA